MIRPINIKLNAAHPELPLVEATTFTGAPSSVFIRGVPKAVGNWSITAVSVAVTYPDNTTTARAAVESAEGVWVATIPGTATSGRTAAGFKIMADGIDENGAAVTGYVLGFADFSVLSFTPVPAPGGTFYLLRYFDQAPATPKEGDAAKIDGVLKFYNGSAWEPFAAPPTLDDTVTRTSANGVKSSGIWSMIWGALSALPTGFSSLYDWCAAQLAGKMSSNATGADIAVSGTDATKIDAALAGKASTADAALTPIYSDTPTFSEWSFNPATDRYGHPYVAAENGLEYILAANGEVVAVTESYSNATMVSWVIDTITITTATRTRTDILGYTLGSQTDKPLASESEAEALRTGKQDALSAQQLANIAAVPNKANASAIPYSLVTQPIVGNGVILEDRASNSVTISATLSPNTLTIHFLPALIGKARDFAMRLNIAAGVTAPEIAWPQGVTLENDGGEVPEIADGGTGGSSTILYFSETENDGTTAKFLVKGETLTAIAQA